MKIEFTSHTYVGRVHRWGSLHEVQKQLLPRRRSRAIILQAETVGDERKSVTLSTERDRFDDPVAHVSYSSSEFDRETFRYARTVHDRFIEATGARPTDLAPDVDRFGSGAHHMSGCRMSAVEAKGVVDSHGKVHGMSNLYVAGSSIFVNTSGAVNPTLTLLALALRTADRLTEEVKRES